MYRPRAFAVDDTEFLHRFIRGRPFATIAVTANGAVELAYAPVVVDTAGERGGVRFHLARNNPVAQALDGSPMSLSVTGPDAYVSPDWYQTAGLVPTWNYVAVEGRGVARRLSNDELRTLLVDLSAAQEEQLRPKQPWTIDKIPPERLDALVQAIAGFSISFESLEGKFKLSQDKKPEDIAGVIAGLEARGDVRAGYIALAMKRTKRSTP